MVIGVGGGSILDEAKMSQPLRRIQEKQESILDGTK